MPAKSKSQQRLFGMLHAFNKGEFHGGKGLRKRLSEMSRHISDEDARHFAETPHKNLPEKKASFIPTIVRLVALTKLAQAGAAVVPTTGDVWHTVAKGDTLSGIAKAYSGKWRDIQALNGLQNPDRIRIGQRLLIRKGAPQVQQTQQQVQQTQPTGSLYTVKPGDILSRIAARGKFRWQDITNEDGTPIANPDKISPGQVLRLPAQQKAVQTQKRVLSANARGNFNNVAKHLRKTFNDPALEAAILANIGRESGYTFDHTTWQNNKRQAFDPEDLTQTGGYGLFQFTGPTLRSYKEWLTKNKRSDSMENQVAFVKGVYGPNRVGWKSMTNVAKPVANRTMESLADWWHRSVETPRHTLKDHYDQDKIDRVTNDHNGFMSQFKATNGGWSL